jgi:hypothetical protein
MMKPLLMAAALLAATPAAAADKRMVSYDATSPSARALTGAGLTFVFTKSFLRTRVLAVRATAVPVGVIVEPSGDQAVNRKLDALMGEQAGSGALYEIKAGKAQGDVMVQAFCPGSTRGWLAISSIAHARPLRVHAFGDDPASGDVRLCSVMDFDFRGEWRMPRENTADPTDYVFSPNW